MAWQTVYSWLKHSSREDADRQLKTGVAAGACGAPERDSAVHHLRQVVLPLFREIALAANASGYYGIAEMVVAPSPGNLAETGPSHAMGASLGLGRMQPQPGRECDGVIKALHTGGAAFMLIRRTPQFDRSDRVSMEGLNEMRLIEIVREVTSHVFR
jgi:hypothetical protein